MKKLAFSAAILALSAGMAIADSHGRTIRMGTEGAYPPYNFINASAPVPRSWDDTDARLSAHV